ncbi:stage III sporulation protein AG [Anaerotaenia torta]|uniref:stage III sporulation protein AG n=1 Tax=Anaerotaenia torta TaxID=433293 RepID=UPI003D211F47
MEEKKKISLKQIGLPRLIMLFMAGILIIFLSFPSVFGIFRAQDKDEEKEKAQIQQNDTNTTSYAWNTYISEKENKLKAVLRKVSGVGEVEVMITVKGTQERIPLKDSSSTQESLNEDDGEGGSRIDNSARREESTVLVTNENGNSVPYILQELEPEIEGVVVIAEGGDNPAIKMDIMEAVEVLFNVPAHKVKVMKMKDGIK